MPIVPPIVRSDRIGGAAAYLLAWYETEPGQWRAEISWMEWEGHAWISQRAQVLADMIEVLKGENYRSVPKYKLTEWTVRENDG